MNAHVIIKEVIKKYGDFHAVDRVSLDIQKGELFTLLGPSGCGKTTLLRMIAGFNSIEEGTIAFGDKVINNIEAHKRNIGMVFQNYAIFPHMTVFENVAYGLKARKIAAREIEERVKEALSMVQIYELKDRQPANMSGGQQQRVALARAIVIHPDILLMDEPLSNLDAKLRVQMRTTIKKVQKKLGITTIYVTHDQEEALAISDRIAVMKDGRIQQVGAPKTIYSRPSNEFVANFIGTSNILKGKRLEKDGSKQVVEVLKRVRISLPLSGTHSDNLKISIRPEEFSIMDQPDNALQGTVTLRTFLGDFINYEIELEDGTIVEANQYSKDMKEDYEPGDRVYLKPMEERINVFDETGEEALVSEEQ